MDTTYKNLWFTLGSGYHNRYGKLYKVYPIMLQEVDDAVKMVKNRKAMGSDNILTELLKYRGYS